MTIPYPVEYQSGAIRDPAKIEISNLYQSLGWAARALDEIATDAQLDKKKVQWLMGACPSYRNNYAKLAARIAREGVQADPDYPGTRAAGTIAGMVRGYLAAEKMAWATVNAMLADLSAFDGECNTIVTWIDANLPEWRTNISTVSASGNDEIGRPIMLETTAKVSLPPDLLAAVQGLRARFGPR